jgi:predicted DNA-binding protein
VPTLPQRLEEQESLETLLVRLPSNLKEQIRQRASVEERTQAQVVRRALRHYLAEVPASS